METGPAFVNSTSQTFCVAWVGLSAICPQNRTAFLPLFGPPNHALFERLSRKPDSHHEYQQLEDEKRQTDGAGMKSA
jgi:hypothetical protein